MKTFSLIIFSLLLTGCGLFGPKIVDKRPDPVIIVNKHLVAYQCPPAPQVDNVSIRNINWNVISRKELDAYIIETLFEFFDIPIDEDEMTEQLIMISVINKIIGDFFFMPGEEVIWSLSADDYSGLGLNTSDFIAGLAQLKAVAIHYKECNAQSIRLAQERNEAEVATLVQP